MRAACLWPLLLASCAVPEDLPTLPAGDVLRQRTMDRLSGATSLQWTVELVVEEDEGGLYSNNFPPRRTWSFQVRGKDRVH